MPDKIEIKPTIEQLIPANGQYPSPEQAKLLADQKAKEIEATYAQMPDKGGRAG